MPWQTPITIEVRRPVYETLLKPPSIERLKSLVSDKSDMLNEHIYVIMHIHF